VVYLFDSDYNLAGNAVPNGCGNSKDRMGLVLERTDCEMTDKTPEVVVPEEWKDVFQDGRFRFPSQKQLQMEIREAIAANPEYCYHVMKENPHFLAEQFMPETFAAYAASLEAVIEIVLDRYFDVNHMAKMPKVQRLVIEGLSDKQLAEAAMIGDDFVNDANDRSDWVTPMRQSLLDSLDKPIPTS